MLFLGLADAYQLIFFTIELSQFVGMQTSLPTAKLQSTHRLYGLVQFAYTFFYVVVNVVDNAMFDRMCV